MAPKTAEASSRSPWYRHLVPRSISPRWVVAGAVLLAIGVVILIEKHRYDGYENTAIAKRSTLQIAAAKGAASGPDIELGNGDVDSPKYCIVKATPPDLPSEIWRGDSIPVVFRLTDANDCAPHNISGFAPETNGLLTPTLIVADCTVTPQTQVLAKPTALEVQGFVWQWTVDDCTSTGEKAVLLLLMYSGKNPAGDPVAYRALQFVHVTDNFTADEAIKFAAPVSLVLGAITSILGLFFGKREKSSDGGA
jgi:hypothetical protein